jgi:hypothetical protein
MIFFIAYAEFFIHNCIYQYERLYEADELFQSKCVLQNGEIFRNERSSERLVISRICDDLVIWCKRLRNVTLVNSLKD